jgi:hypothetical protein
MSMLAQDIDIFGIGLCLVLVYWFLWGLVWLPLSDLRGQVDVRLLLMRVPIFVAATQFDGALTRLRGTDLASW